MSSRSQQKDTNADRELYLCLNSTPPKSFLMVAGAGSGKTTSLIKGLSEILAKRGEALKVRRQRVACITYTEIAAKEVWTDVGQNPLVHVSTIHSFLWSLIRTFQLDIKKWVINRIDEKILELNQVAAKFGPRVQQRTRDKNQSDIVRYGQQRTLITSVNSFKYGNGSNYVDGILGHDDIIKMVPQFILERPLMRTLLAQQFPFLFVDESQDTTENVVAALKAVDQDLGNQFCLGFFGDPMQRIYPTGIGAIQAGEGWASITKPENFRCPSSVLKVANAIRRDGDGLVQTRGRMTGLLGAEISLPGIAHLFVLPSDGRRDLRIAQVRAWTAAKTLDPAWHDDEENDAVKFLVIVHRMAAKRLGFGDLYSALNDKAPDGFKNGFLDGSAWPVRPFNKFVLPLVSAAKQGNEFDVMQVLRTQSPLLERDKLNGIDIAKLLSELRRFTQALQQMLAPNSQATNSDVLLFLHSSKLISLDPRILSYLNLPLQSDNDSGGATKPAESNEEEDGEEEEELTKEVIAMDAFLACPARQFWGYYNYVKDESPFSTQQGIKGAEFERVLVILDDDEGTHTQFSYDKYLGIKPLSDRDEENRRAGRETTVDRTRRLFYVCCTRALRDLIVVLFTNDVANARRQVTALGLFPDESIHVEDDLTAINT